MSDKKKPISKELRDEIAAWERLSMETLSETYRKLEKKSPSEEEKKRMVEAYKENAGEDLKLAKEFEDCDEDLERIEREEDEVRISKSKSIRIQGKYKARGKEKRREP